MKDINGKKAAKEECAKGVLEFLTEWMKKTQDESKVMDKENSIDKENSEDAKEVGEGDEKVGGD